MNYFTMVRVKRYKGRNIVGIEWQVLEGDALTALKLLDDEIVDCVVTSPPNFWLRDYGVEDQIGLEETVEGDVSALCAVMSEVYRVLGKQGTLFLNLGDTYYSGKGKSHGQDMKSRKRRFGLRAVDKSLAPIAPATEPQQARADEGQRKAPAPKPR